MAAALPFVGAGLAALNVIQGAKAQGQQNRISQEQLEAIRQQQRLGRLLGRTGAVGNPFSAAYGPLFDQADAAAAPQPQQGRILRQFGLTP